MYKLIIKDAFWQIVGRVISAFAGLIVIYLITPYLGTVRYGDYGTLISYFAFWSALSDLGFYVLGLRQIGHYMTSIGVSPEHQDMPADKRLEVEKYYSKVVFSRRILIVIVYTVAIGIAYLIPSYHSNPYIVYGLPFAMLFSALFMGAGIIQLPLQIFWKMEQVSISLILARLGQITFLFLIVYVIFPKQDGPISLTVFIRIFGSIVLSSTIQFIYTYFFAKKSLKLRQVPFGKFTIQTIKENRKYGIGYFLSSSPILAVVLMLSRFFPTIHGDETVGIRSLSLQIVTILLIIPPSIGNSILHKLTDKTKEQIKVIFGNFFSLMLFAGVRIMTNFYIFGQEIIGFIGGKEYVSGPDVRNHLSSRFEPGIKSDIVLVFLSIVLLISFIKQVFNYLTISQNNQNKLFLVNLIGILIGFGIGFFAIPRYGIIGGVITQLIFEICFITGLYIINHKNQTIPDIKILEIVKIGLFFVTYSYLFFRFAMYDTYGKIDFAHFVGYIVGFNIIVVSCRFVYLKNRFKKLI